MDPAVGSGITELRHQGEDPLGRTHYWFAEEPTEQVEEGTDRWAVERGMVSLTLSDSTPHRRAVTATLASRERRRGLHLSRGWCNCGSRAHAVELQPRLVDAA